jgi:EAL domain-containing protein (putative c-di-GMP-specific phosphodiesterase class I)
VRWHHPEHGLLSPAQFIALAERSGAIVPLGRWVLAKACWQAKHWYELFGDRAPYVSVNLAPRQVAEPDLVDDVAAVLGETGLPPERVQLEITEQAVLDDQANALPALRELGVRLAIDDFGTGYANFARLRRRPLAHALKVDGSFITALRGSHGADPADVAIVDSLIKMAHALGLVVTAEWVETADQARQLAELGCDLGQGRYFGDAVPAARIEHLLRATTM